MIQKPGPVSDLKPLGETRFLRASICLRHRCPARRSSVAVLLRTVEKRGELHFFEEGILMKGVPGSFLIEACKYTSVMKHIFL
jgi:hypothetical protein